MVILKSTHEKEIESLKKTHNIELAQIQMEKAFLEQQLKNVDEALARRPAVAHLDTRYGKIRAAFDMAQKADKVLKQQPDERSEFQKELDDLDMEIKLTNDSQPLLMAERRTKRESLLRLKVLRTNLQEKINREGIETGAVQKAI